MTSTYTLLTPVPGENYEMTFKQPEETVFKDRKPKQEDIVTVGNPNEQDPIIELLTDFKRVLNGEYMYLSKSEALRRIDCYILRPTALNVKSDELTSETNDNSPKLTSTDKSGFEHIGA